MSDPVRAILAAEALEITERPFPHAVVDGFFRADLFRELRHQFPDIVKMERPRGWGQSLYRGDEGYEAHLEASPAWRQVVDAVYSQAFVDWTVARFADLWEREGCTIDLSRATFVPWCEDRIDKERLQLRRVEHAPHELWCRLDFYQSYQGYYRPVHLDHRRRLISMLVYFDDPEEIGMQGGELILHPPGPDLGLLERLGVYHAPQAFSLLRDRLARTLVLRPKSNRMAVFPCGRWSWHSVPAVRSARSPRQHIQITVSSSVDAWR